MDVQIGDEGHDGPRIGPSGRCRPDEAVDECGHPEGGGGGARQVEVSALALGLGQEPGGERDQHGVSVGVQFEY